MQHKIIDIEDVVIRFAGDSGDGMQLTGTLFADSSALSVTRFLLSRTILQRYVPLRVLFQVCRGSRYTSVQLRSTPRETSAMFLSL